MSTPEFLYGMTVAGSPVILAVKDIVAVDTEGESSLAIVHFQRGTKVRHCRLQCTVADVSEILSCPVLPITRDT